MGNYFKELFEGSYSLAVGMGITLKNFVSPVVTMQYPHEHMEMPKLFRGHIELIKDEETGESKCIVCGMCQKACPSGCITVAGAKVEGKKGKTLTKYILDFTKCSLCGSCVESCKPGAITFSNEYNVVSCDRNDFVFDLLKRMKEND